MLKQDVLTTSKLLETFQNQKYENWSLPAEFQFDEYILSAEKHSIKAFLANPILSFSLQDFFQAFK